MTIQVTQHNGYKAISSIPGWSEELTGATDKISGTPQAYALVPIIYRAVRLRCDALSSVPVVIEQGGKAVDWPFKSVDPVELIWKTEASLLLNGAAYWLKVGKGRRVSSLQWLNPFTMTVKYANGILTYHQQIGSWSQDYGADEIVYIKEFNPSDDIGPGVSAASVALNDAGLMRYMSRFASAFFEGGAMPVVLLGIEGNPPDSEIKKVESFFKRAATSIRNAWRVLGVRAGMIHPSILTPAIKDLVIPQLNDQARRAIAAAFGIPQTMLEDAANFATADAHEKQFWRGNVQPRGMLITGAANLQLWRAAGMEMSFNFESLDVFQQEESERSASLNIFIDFISKCPTYEIAKEAAVNFGYELTDELLAAIKKWFSEKEKKAEDIQQDTATPSANDSGQDDNAQTIAELRAWRRKAARQMKAGKQPGGFDSEYIPASLSGAIEGQLEEAKTRDAVDQIFAAAIEGIHGRA